MDNQKADNVLNLALDITAEERDQSEELATGYDAGERTWELIVRYGADRLDRVRELSETVTALQSGYAIVVIREDAIPALLALEEVEFVEKPKMLFFSRTNGKRVSCVQAVQQGTPFSLYGAGVLVGVVDSGIAYENPAFRYADGRTRILRLWDQSLSGSPPDGYQIGTEYTQEQINRALGVGRQQEGREEFEEEGLTGDGGERSAGEGTSESQPLPTRDLSGHGTAVAGIVTDVASQSELIVVKLAKPRENGFPSTTELMQGLNYIVETALREQRPVAINVSFGNTYGSHNGTSLVERFLDDLSGIWKTVICVGSGNEGVAAGHTSGRVRSGADTRVALSVGSYQTAFSIQIWKSYVDQIDISFITPSGERIGPIREQMGTARYLLGNQLLLIYYGEPSPYSTSQEIYVQLLPNGDYLDSGNWQIVLTPRSIKEGSFQLWLPSNAALQGETRFLRPTGEATFTIPSTASRVISVAAYDALDLQYGEFSGRGYDWQPIDREVLSPGQQAAGIYKPDLAAPGVEITAPTPQGGEAEFTGTSFATPFVTGGAALLMEWGIVKGNDPFLYGEKVKAYLRRGATPLPGFTEYPNNQVGWGALCVKESLPG